MAGMEGMMAKLATKYGTAVDGKHKGSEINLGTDPNKKVEVGARPTHAVFIEGQEVKGRYRMGTDIVGLTYVSGNDDKVVVELKFADGETTTVELTPPKPQGLVEKILKMMSGKAPENPNDPAVKYQYITAFLLAFSVDLTDYPAGVVYDYLKAHKVFVITDGSDADATEADKHKALIKLCVERFAVKVQAGNQNAARR